MTSASTVLVILSTWTVVTSWIPQSVFKNPTGGLHSPRDEMPLAHACGVLWAGPIRNQCTLISPPPLPKHEGSSSYDCLSAASSLLSGIRTHLLTSLTTEPNLMWLSMPIIPQSFLNPFSPALNPCPRPISDNTWVRCISLCTNSGWNDPLLRIKHQHLDEGWKLE